MDVTPITQVLEAMPDGPYVVVNFESPFPALENFVAGDVNVTGQMHDLNTPFGNDAFDINVTDSHDNIDSHDTNVSDIADVNTMNGVVADMPAPAGSATAPAAEAASAPAAEATSAPTEAAAETAPAETAPAEAAPAEAAKSAAEPQSKIAAFFQPVTDFFAGLGKK